MGVKVCSRAGCENIMCERYSDEYGYLCYECFEDLVNLGVMADIEVFLNTSKRNKKISEARFDAEFPLI